jgi:hypothetical protein
MGRHDRHHAVSAEKLGLSDVELRDTIQDVFGTAAKVVLPAKPATFNDPIYDEAALLDPVEIDDPDEWMAPLRQGGRVGELRLRVDFRGRGWLRRKKNVDRTTSED